MRLLGYGKGGGPTPRRRRARRRSKCGQTPIHFGSSSSATT
jgi:hypothetical protein